MKIYIFRKILVVLIIILPVFSWSGCKKQVKCGCNGDILRSMSNELMDRSQIIYSSDGASAYFTMSSGYYYDTYYFCNPGEMYAKFKELAGDDQIILSGDLYWECTYMMNSSNSSYYSYYYKVYNINVTELKSYLYGKK
jgi:hypothetical protein